MRCTVLLYWPSNDGHVVVVSEWKLNITKKNRFDKKRPVFAQKVFANACVFAGVYVCVCECDSAPLGKQVI